MNSRSVNELVGMAPVKKPPASHPGYLSAGSHDCPGIPVSDTLWRAVTRHIAQLCTPSLAAKSPPTILVVQSAPGLGKTKGVSICCSRARADVLLTSPSEYAGETENAGGAALERVMHAIHAITAREGRPLVLVLDDFDLSSAARLDHTEYTVNSQLFIGALQHVCDTGCLRTAQGTRVPIIMTGNDFSTLRSSLLRPGRAIFHEHKVSFEEKIAMVLALFTPHPSEEKTVRALVKAYRNEPIAFFADLRSRTVNASLDAIIDYHGVNIAAIEREFADVAGHVDLSTLHDIASQAIRERAANYL